jgi:hypothetical protein
MIIIKPFNPSSSDLSILSWCCTLYRWLFWLQHLRAAPSIFAQTILRKIKRFMAKVMHHNIYHLWSVHGVASSSKIRRLTNGCASSITLGCLRFPKVYLVAVGTIRLLFFFVVVFNHMTMMPCRNLRPHVRCSHMIEPLGAHWQLGICDVTPLQSLLMQPY